MKREVASFWASFCVAISLHLVVLASLYVGGALGIIPLPIRWQSFPVEIVGREALGSPEDVSSPQAFSTPSRQASEAAAAPEASSAPPVAPRPSPSPAESGGSATSATIHVLVPSRSSAMGLGRGPLAGIPAGVTSQAVRSGPVANNSPSASEDGVVCGPWPFPCVRLPEAPPRGIPGINPGPGLHCPCCALLLGGARSDPNEPCPLERALGLGESLSGP